jgi:hypothetical protein
MSAVGLVLRGLVAVGVVREGDGSALVVRRFEKPSTPVAAVLAVGAAIHVADRVHRALDDTIGAALAHEATATVVLEDTGTALGVEEGRDLIVTAPLVHQRVELLHVVAPPPPTSDSLACLVRCRRLRGWDAPREITVATAVRASKSPRLPVAIDLRGEVPIIRVDRA